MNTTPRAEEVEQRAEGVNLLRVPGVRALILWRGFPYVFQAVLLATLLVLIAVAWRRYTPPGVAQKLYAQTNLATLLIWGLWWPAMVWITVFLGRAWCMVCPLELVSNVSERIGRRFRLRQRPLHLWIASGAVIVVLYALIQFLVAGAEIRRVPAYTSLFLIGLLALAVLTGLLFRDRAFCRGFCPIGLLLSAYGRGGMLAVRAGSGEACRACTDKNCIRACNRYKADGRSCPSLLNPPVLNDNKECLLCGQCIKVCEPDNMRLLLRRPFSANDARDAAASWPMTLFVMTVSGFVLWELTTEWATAQKVFLAVPRWISQYVSAPSLSSHVTVFWATVVVPLLIWSFFGLLARLLGHNASLGALWRRLALPMAVIVAGGHIAKGLAKFVSWAGFLPYAFEDPSGFETAAAISGGLLQPPVPLLSKPFVAVVAAVIVAGALFLAMREARLANHGKTGFAMTAPLLLTTAVFLFLTIGWALPA
ncbi:MAG TPA: 4Fe-4S binding protein [Candidatus Hydrogenedentes bacterium]|nr:4Fe-4S binding protein [Candidatus Hydrogenedentota bacterium]